MMSCRSEPDYRLVASRLHKESAGRKNGNSAQTEVLCEPSSLNPPLPTIHSPHSPAFLTTEHHDSLCTPAQQSSVLQ